MAQVTYTLVSTTSLSSSYTAYCDEFGNKWTNTPTTASRDFTFTYDEMGIQSGSTINAVYFRVESLGSPLHGTSIREFRINGTSISTWFSAETNYDITSYCTTGTNTITLRFKSGTSSTSWPTQPLEGVNSKSNSSSLTFNYVNVIVDYTLPYTACGAPSTVGLTATTIDAGISTTLSWSGASAGNSNAITGYQIYRSANGGSFSLLQSVTSGSTSGSITVTAHSTMGNYYTYKIITVGTISGYNSGYSGTVTLTSRVYTNCSAPSSVAVTLGTIDSGGSFTLSWSGAAGGTNNAIAGYQIFHSTNNSTFTLAYSVSSGATSGSKSFTLTSSDDVTYYYKIYTIGTNTSFNSVASATVSVSVLTYTNCTAPSSVIISSALAESNVTLTWSGAAAGRNNPIAHYKIRYQESVDNVNWGTVTDLTTTTSTYLSVSPSVTRGYYKRFLVCAIGTKSGYDSGYTTGGTVRKNQIASAPSVIYPVNGSNIYNPKPYVKVTVGSEPDGQKQTMKASNGTYTVSSASTYNAGAAVALQFADSLSGSNTITFRGNDGLADGNAVTAAINVLTPSWTDGTLSGVPIKAAHINEIRAIVDDIRAYYGLAAYAWTDAPVVANVTPIKALHLTQIQNAMKDCAAARGATLSFTSVAHNTRIRAAHIQELRNTAIQL